MGEFFGEWMKRRSPEKESGVPAPGQVHHSGAGRPLDSSTLAVMGSRFGYDFGGVRVHDGPEAAGSARALNARAYTVGSDVFLGDGQHIEGILEGQELIAHELTHVVQQSANHLGAGANVQNLPISDGSEGEAVQVEDAIVRHQSMPAVSGKGVAVMRAGILPTQAAVVSAIKKLVDTKYGGDYKAAFDHYAKNGAVDKDGVVQLVKDAGYGGMLDPTSAIASAIMKAVDANGDGKISWEEFNAVMHK
jgi:hypothetical protein